MVVGVGGVAGSGCVVVCGVGSVIGALLQRGCVVVVGCSAALMGCRGGWRFFAVSSSAG